MVKKPLRQALVRKAVLLSLPPGIILLGLLIYFFYTWGRQQAIETSHFISQQVTAQVEASLKDRRNDLLHLNIFFKIEDNWNSSDSILKEIFAESNHILQLEKIVYLTDSGKVKFVYPRNAEEIGNDYSGMPFFQASFQSTGNFWSEMTRVPGVGASLVNLTFRKDNGFISAWFSIQQLSTLLENTGKNTGMKLAILDKNGTYIAHTDQGKAQRREVDPFFQQNTNADRIEKIWLDGASWHVEKTDIRDTDWKLFCYQKEKDMMAPLFKILPWMIFLGLLIVFAAMWAAARQSSQMARSVEMLGSQMKNLEEGQKQIERFESPYLELDHVAAVFSSMAQSVKERERHLRTLVENIPDIILRIDITGRLIYVSPSVFAAYALHPSVLLNHKISELKRLKEILPYLEHECEKVISSRKAAEIESRGLLSGKAVVNNLRLIPVLGSQNEIQSVLCLVRDLTQFRKTQETLKHSQKENEKLIDSIEGIIWSADPQTFGFKFVSRFAEKLLGYPVQKWYEKDFWIRHLHPEDMWAADFYKNSVEQLKSHEYEYRMISADGRAVWIRDVVSVESHAGRPSSLQGVMFDITEKKNSQLALAESEKRYRLIAENMADIIYTMDLDFNLTYVSPSVERLRGWSFDELKNIPIQQQMTESSWQIVSQALSQIMAEKNLSSSGPSLQVSFEIEFFRKNNTSFWAETTFMIIRNPDGKPVKIIATGRDISARRAAQQALKASEEKFRSIVENTDDLIYSLSLDGKILYFSPNISRYGYSTGEFIGRSFFDLIHPDDEEKVRQSFIHASTGYVTNTPLHLRLKLPGGGWLDSEVMGKMVRGADTVLTFNGILRDISQRIAAEARLRSLNQTVEQSPAMVLITSTNAAIEYVNNSFTRITGYAADEVIGKNPRILQSGQTSQEVYTALWATLSRGGTWKGEFLNKKKNGEVFWEETIISPLKDENGKVIQYVSVKEDITSRKLGEIALTQALLDKEMLLAEVHHRVKNNLQTVASIINLQSMFIEQPEVRKFLAETASRVRSMGLIHQRLYQTGNFEAVDMESYLGDLTKTIRISFGRPDQKIEINLSVSGIKLNIDTAIPLGLLVNEIMTNSYKHAFSPMSAGLITLSLTRIQPELFELKIQDNGAGMPQENFPDKGGKLGFQLIHSLTTQISGKLEILPPPGTGYKIVFKEVLKEKDRWKNDRGQAINDKTVIS